MMRYINKGIKLLPLTLAAVCLMAVPSFAVEYYLCAQSFTMNMPDGTPVPMWGFSMDDNADLGDGCPAGATVPGPKLTVPSGDSELIIHLSNDLSGPGIEPVSVVIPGQAMPTNSLPVMSGGRVRSFVQEAATGGGTQTYTWNNIQPGTYIYQSGTHPQVQVQMGLYGALTKNSAAGMAYPGVSFSTEKDLFYSEVDPVLHAAVDDGTYGTPQGPTSTLGYKPKYFLLNGYFGSAPYDISIDTEMIPPTCIRGFSQGDNILVRMYNAGLRELAPMMIGSHYDLVAEGGKPYPFARTQYQTLLMPGSTKDAVFTPGYNGEFKIIERRLNLTDATASGRGMQTCIATGPVNLPGMGSIADFDGDGNTDVLLRNALNGRWNLYLMNGATVTPNLNIDLPTDSAMEIVGIADFDGINGADVLMRNSVSGQWNLYLMAGATVTPNLNIDLPIDSTWELAGIANFDGVNGADVLFQSSANNRWRLYLMNGAAVTPNYNINLPSNSDLELVGIADFDGANGADVLFRNSVNGRWNLYLMNGAAVTPNLNIALPKNSAVELAGIADFDGANGADVLTRNSVNGRWNLYLMNGAAITSNIDIGLPSNSDLELVGIADFDGANGADVLTRNSVNGRWNLYLMNGAAVTPNLNIALPKNSAMGLAGIADFDGLTGEDVLIRDSMNGFWNLYLMNGATVTPNLNIALPTDLNLQ